MRTPVQLQQAARAALDSGDQSTYQELQDELIKRFVLGQRIEAVILDGTQSSDARVCIEFENGCGLIFQCDKRNPFGIKILNPE